MNWLKPSWQALLAILLCLVALALGAMSKPEAAALADPAASFNYPYFGIKTPMIGLAVLAGLISMARIPSLAEAVVLFIGAHLVAWMLISGITGFEGTALAPYFLLLAGAYYSQSIDIWSALVAGSVVAALLVLVVGIAGRLVDRAMGGRPA